MYTNFKVENIFFWDTFLLRSLPSLYSRILANIFIVKPLFSASRSLIMQLLYSKNIENIHNYANYVKKKLESIDRNNVQ